MSKQTINIGASPNDGTGTPLRTSFDYTNQNFTEIYTALGGGVALPGATTQVIFNDGGTNLAGDAGLVYNKTTDALTVAGLVTAGSATITGALGAAGLNVTAATIPANGVYLGSANNLSFSYASTLGMTLNSTGLGIGISPAVKGHFYSASGSNELRLETAATGAGSTNRLSFKNASGATDARTGAIEWYDVASFKGDIRLLKAGGIQIRNSADSLTFNLDDTGNVGIGNTSPNSRLQIVGATDNALVQSCIRFSRKGYESSTFGVSISASGGSVASQNNLVFNTSDGTNAPAERVRIDGDGNLLVGKTVNYSTGETNTLQLKSFLVFGSDNTASAANRNWSISTNVSAAGNMEWTIGSTNIGWPNFAYRMQLTSGGALNNTTGTYGTISDLRLKENVSDARNYLADLLKLRVVKYSLKEESSAVATKLGFIAQEVEQVFPNLVDQSDKEYEGAEGIRSVKTSILIPMLLKGIQELTARVQTLEAR